MREYNQKLFIISLLEVPHRSPTANSTHKFSQETPFGLGAHYSAAQTSTYYGALPTNLPSARVGESKSNFGLFLQEPKQKYEEPTDGSNDSSESDSDDEADSYPVFVPARSPLRNSFGIFCTGRGRDGGVGMGTARAAFQTRGVIRPKQSTANAQRP